MPKIFLELKDVADVLRFAAEESGWSEGDEPVVMISYASPDREVVDLLRTNLDRALEGIDGGGRPYSAWDYEARDEGTTLGGHFPSEIAEKMWRCRAAVVVWSQDYVRSDYCFKFELPFLLWRFQQSRLRFFLIRVNPSSVDKEPVFTPGFRDAPVAVRLLEITDDRNPNLMPLVDDSKGQWLGELMHSHPPKAKERMASFVANMCRLIREQEAIRSGRIVDGGDTGSDHPSTPHVVDRPHRKANVLILPRSAVVWAVGIIVAVVALAVAALSFRPETTQPGRPIDAAAARRACDAAAMSPQDPRARPGEGVSFDALDPARLPDCDRALATAPDDAALLFQTGRLLEKAGRDREAFEAYLRAWQKGLSLAANNIGVVYRDRPYVFRDLAGGHGCENPATCDRQALTWFATADDGRNAAAAFNLGIMYEQRRGTDGRNDDLGCSEGVCEERAVAHYRVAERLGDGVAAYRLARLADARADRLSRGEKVSGDWCRTAADCGSAAVTMAAAAAAAGIAPAQAFLGTLYEGRKGVLGAPSPLGCETPRACDLRAIEWYRAAAPSIPAAAARLETLTATLRP